MAICLALSHTQPNFLVFGGHLGLKSTKKYFLMGGSTFGMCNGWVVKFCFGSEKSRKTRFFEINVKKSYRKNILTPDSESA